MHFVNLSKTSFSRKQLMIVFQHMSSVQAHLDLKGLLGKLLIGLNRWKRRTHLKYFSIADLRFFKIYRDLSSFVELFRKNSSIDPLVESFIFPNKVNTVEHSLAFSKQRCSVILLRLLRRKKGSCADLYLC
jgi:hypothetical protein